MDRSYSVNYEQPEDVVDEVKYLMEFCESLADNMRNTDDINYIYRVDCLKYADIAVALNKALDDLEKQGIAPIPPVIVVRNPKRRKQRRKPALI